ncbi:PQQ-binding-like beta-propeller repeat protein [Sphaerisporangium sp. TRM90804]|uniref:outer membrane protein assembly factor BamB family protein n=1 Tax=Sphaerisporangium sp. TRM90804 TaxID=3031113 RepID=UPI00244D1746|nr:PQQ-binding-like beta-propeller repeat protein [Sphaerisporangium sp. TRM90804]MDH2428778.1 PQQ-binding-like beta-propeller repeat protein [Sphaerisporangium sp. TRM90804]
MPVIRPLVKPALALAGAMALAACSGSKAATEETLPTWHNAGVNAVSRATVAAGAAAVTSMRPDGTLETAAVDLATGRRLWSHPAAIAGRLPGMGVQPPAAVEAAPGRAVVAAVAPAASGKAKATLVVRDARGGRQLWARPLQSTFGPQRCGVHICLAENTSLASARMVVLHALTGEVLWKLPGIAEVEWSDSSRVVVLRLAKHPLLASYDLRTGKLGWRLPLEEALSPGIDLSGGWAFGTAGGDLIGYVAPYTNPKDDRTSTFGLFSVKLADGAVNWLRPSVVRVYPSGNPGMAPVVRPVDQQGQYGGFARLDPASGRVVGQITADQVPGAGWWLAFPSDMSRLGFLKPGTAGASYDLTSGQAVPLKDERGWSFCVTDPQPLQLTGAPRGFYSVAALCEFDLATGKRAEGPGVPPEWFTGSHEGWRLWRDDKGGLHAVRDTTGTAPGMYG